MPFLAHGPLFFSLMLHADSLPLCHSWTVAIQYRASCPPTPPAARHLAAVTCTTVVHLESPPPPPLFLLSSLFTSLMHIFFPFKRTKPVSISYPRLGVFSSLLLFPSIRQSPVFLFFDRNRRLPPLHSARPPISETRTDRSVPTPKTPSVAHSHPHISLGSLFLHRRH